MIHAHDLIQFNSTDGVELIKHIFRVSPKTQLFGALRNQGIITRRITWLLLSTLSIPPPVQPSLLVSWPFYNSKSSIPNRSASPFERKNKKTFSYFWVLVRAPYSAIPMAGPCACWSLCRNFPLASEDQLANAAPTEGNSTFTSTSAVSRVPTPASAIAPFLDNKLFKQLIKAYLKAQVPGRIEVDSKPCKQSLKAWFPDLYYGNLHMDCYRFC